MPRRLLFTLLVASATLGACRAQTPPETTAPALADSSFAGLVARLSEPGGYFDTDNLISNERSYQHVLDTLAAWGLEGGAYVGVGPDQNFTYIARLRPSVAFIVDIRRDNLLQHLFFKALFAEAPTRVEYLCLLVGRPAPEDAAAWTDRGVEALVGYVDAAPSAPAHADEARRRVRKAVDRLGVPLDEADRATIERIHDRFIADGLDLRFTSHGRPPRAYYPTYRQLLLETDRGGRRGVYLAREDDYRFLRALQARGGVVPVVGDLGGTHALRAVAAEVAARGETVTAVYTSNVEFYLMQQGTFGRFIENLRALPLGARSVVVRSYFNRYGAGHPETVPGYASTQLLQPVRDLLGDYDRQGRLRYADLLF